MVFKVEQRPLPGIKPLKKLKKKARLDGRWAIVGLFGLTVLASLVFYFQTEAPKIWQKITSPAVVSTLPGKFDSAPVLEEIETLTKDLGGTYGVYVYRFEEQVKYGLHQDEVFPAASLIKLPVILTLYQEAEKGNEVADYKKMAEAMGKRSDNAAFNKMVKVLGQEKIQKTIDDLGMKKTSFAKNETTPKDIGLFFHQLYQAKIISDEHRDEFLGFLTDTEFESRIPAGIPEGIRVAHKIGTEIGSFSDAGIVFSDPPVGGFVLVIMSKNARQSEANQAIPAISKAVWEFEAGTKQ